MHLGQGILCPDGVYDRGVSAAATALMVAQIMVAQRRREMVGMIFIYFLSAQGHAMGQAEPWETPRSRYQRFTKRTAASVRRSLRFCRSGLCGRAG